MESAHDPVKHNNQVDYVKEPTNDSFITKLSFNESGQVVKEEKFNSKGVLGSSLLRKYDNRGTNYETQLFHLKKLFGRIINKYDSSGNLVASEEIDPNGTIRQQQKSAVDNNQNRVLTTYQILHAQPVKTDEVTFDSQNHIVKSESFTNGQLVYTEINEYDERGNQIGSVKQYHLKKDRKIFQYKYDQNNCRIEMVILDRNFMIESRVAYKYDAFHNPLKTFTYGTDGTLREVKSDSYQYDEAGNWIKKTTFLNGKPVLVTIRNIEYF
jgi:hypothetical protein